MKETRDVTSTVDLLGTLRSTLITVSLTESRRMPIADLKRCRVLMTAALEYINGQIDLLQLSRPDGNMGKYRDDPYPGQTTSCAPGTGKKYKVP